MNRRSFLAIGASGLGAIAGCASLGGEPSQSTASTSTDPPSSKSSPTEPRTETQTAVDTKSSQDDSRTIYVSPDGHDQNEGGLEDPFATIQRGLDIARPGQTVQVEPGQYFEALRTVRGGTASKPITITGPPDAVVSGQKQNKHTRGLTIRHSNVHLTGLTFDGQQDPSRPDDVESYMRSAIGTLPAGQEYLTNIKIKPHAVGNVFGDLIHVTYSEQVEVGEFRVIGPSGLGYLLTDKKGHWGEIVYVGISPGDSPNAIEPKGELTGIDTSNDIHIHHIDNSEGHAHSELVNTKLGTYDVLVEYCTDGGGSQNTEPPEPAASVRLQSYGGTVRWCDLANGNGHGISVGVGDLPEDETDERPNDDRILIYGNHVRGFEENAFNFEGTRPSNAADAKWMLCGNNFEGQTHAEPAATCPGSVPAGEGVGHTGGDSPW